MSLLEAISNGFLGVSKFPKNFCCADSIIEAIARDPRRVETGSRFKWMPIEKDFQPRIWNAPPPGGMIVGSTPTTATTHAFRNNRFEDFLKLIVKA